jgi:transcriptional regulator with XRE-family HTH domain
VGDVVYIYESKPVSKIVYKAVVEEINIKRDKPENSDGFYTKDYNKVYAFKLRYEAVNPGNRLQFPELQEKFGVSGMSLINIPQITRKDMIDFFEDVFAGNVEDLPTPPSKEQLYQPLESGTILEYIKHKMDYCEIRDSHLAKQTGISSSSIGRVRKGEAIKSDCMLAILDALGFGFVDSADESHVYGALGITEAIKQRIITSGIRTTELASLCDASPSVISHLKNDGTNPKFEILEKIINYYGFKVILKR